MSTLSLGWLQYNQSDKHTHMHCLHRSENTENTKQ